MRVEIKQGGDGVACWNAEVIADYAQAQDAAADAAACSEGSHAALGTVLGRWTPPMGEPKARRGMLCGWRAKLPGLAPEQVTRGGRCL